MADTELPKPEIIEVDKTQFIPARPNKTITPVQDRLQNSPKKVLTPEVLKERQDKAQQRRQLFEEEKVSKAHAVVEHAKEVRERAKLQPKEAQTDA
ncbi:uncharacterized protein ACA1_064480 [Acanthamoeba castellanii str. Neff]|uniref:Uncharacterized protein n=1 Tax=Acanthamoeba castellanii (strain ATCC 30010 / Neff) TaxID=1257118 RepID=L8GZY4_ACACF|nr:uncharacterized protein ACA1_064480 [Acanthamoeba castellanii str. Neff]ELR17661.1 hypothetical protein ACA1_064480 [Acanthamoeba castellanii str. Neff]